MKLLTLYIYMVLHIYCIFTLFEESFCKYFTDIIKKRIGLRGVHFRQVFRFS